MLDHFHVAFISALLYAVHISVLSAFMLVCVPREYLLPAEIGREPLIP